MENGETVVIDLKQARTKADVLSRIGLVLELGGPSGNHSPNSEKRSGWGMNWDALFDSLTYLDKGGILGNSREFSFPLRIHFVNWRVLKEVSPQEFSILSEILTGVQSSYARGKKRLEFVFA